MIRVVGKRGKGSVESQLDEAAKGVDFVRIDCTSGNPDPVSVAREAVPTEKVASGAIQAEDEAKGK